MTECLKFDQQRQHDGNRTVTADTRIGHDSQHLLFLPASTEAIHRIGQTVLMECAGEQNGSDHAQQNGKFERQHEIAQPEHQRAESTDQDTDQREITRRPRQFSLVITGELQRQAGEEHQRSLQQTPLPDQALHIQSALPETWADSNEAISLRKLTAASNSG